MTRPTTILLRAGLALGLAVLAPPAFARHTRQGSGYGLAGSNPDRALGNVYSGIYGLGYTYDRANYPFNGCGQPAGAASGVLTIRRCR